MLDRVLNFFDKFEDHVRESLSKTPLLYTLIGGIAIVLFWRGVWHTADLFPILTGPVSILISVIVLLATGLFVSFFVGDMIIISGLKKEKKLIEKAESEVKHDAITLRELKEEMEEIKAILKTRK